MSNPAMKITPESVPAVSTKPSTERHPNVMLMFQALIEDILPEHGAAPETIERARQVQLSFTRTEEADEVEGLLDYADRVDMPEWITGVWSLVEACLRSGEKA